MSHISRRRTRSSSAATAKDTSPDLPVPAPILKSKRKHSDAAVTGQKTKKKATQRDLDNKNAEDTPVSHSHETRPTNDPHPGQSAGVHKRTRAEISESAASKQRAKDIVVERREKGILEQTEREQRGIQGVAAMLDARLRQDRAEETAMEEGGERPPASNQRRYGMILDKLRAGNDNQIVAAKVRFPCCQMVVS